jgi:hypothetical protein
MNAWDSTGLRNRESESNQSNETVSSPIALCLLDNSCRGGIHALFCRPLSGHNLLEFEQSRRTRKDTAPTRARVCEEEFHPCWMAVCEWLSFRPHIGRAYFEDSTSAARPLSSRKHERRLRGKKRTAANLTRLANFDKNIQQRVFASGHPPNY